MLKSQITELEKVEKNYLLILSILRRIQDCLSSIFEEIGLPEEIIETNGKGADSAEVSSEERVL